MTFMPQKRTSVRPAGSDNPVGRSAEFKIGGGSGGTTAGSILKNLGTVLANRSAINSAARGRLEETKVNALKELELKRMELEAQASESELAHERSIREARLDNTAEIRKAKAVGEISRLNQTQAGVHTHGVLDRMVTDFPDADLDFTTERGQTIKITRPKGASSESSEGGS